MGTLKARRLIRLTVSAYTPESKRQGKTIGVQRLDWSKNFKKGIPFSNGAHYDNPEVDSLLEAATVELDPVKRTAVFKRFQVIIAQDVPDLTLLTLESLTIYNTKVRDYTVGADRLNGNFARD